MYVCYLRMSSLSGVILVLVIVHLTFGYTPTTRVLHTYENHPCKRLCHPGDVRTCHYDFHLEYYSTMSKACYNCPGNSTDCFRPHCVPADGTQRAILTVNRMLPGPAIHVCQNDTIEVNVHNELVGGEGTSIHWHGVHQRGSQYMDGVGILTQCPIHEASSFLYRFKADPPGTHFWHAHSGLQRADGLFGGLIIRQPLELEPHESLYDQDLPEHTVVVNDWLHELTVSRFASHHFAGGDNKPRAILINGKGLRAPYLNWNGTQTPVEVFHVTRGLRYRFRMISNGVLHCPIRISIDSHTMTMIASDGSPFNKTQVSSFNIFAGERFDFVLNASAAVGNYKIRAIGLGDCRVKQAKQVAVLQYNGAQEIGNVSDGAWTEPADTGKMLNPLNEPGTADHITVDQLTSLNPVDRTALKGCPDKKFYLGMDFYKIDNYHYQDETYYPLSAVDRSTHLYMPQINHISHVLPASPILTQPHDVPESVYCNNNTLQNTDCSKQFCECVHRLQVALGDLVELVVFDEGVTFNASHPMHLHGHLFNVMGMGKTKLCVDDGVNYNASHLLHLHGHLLCVVDTSIDSFTTQIICLGASTSVDEVKQMDNNDQLQRNLVNPVAKDTVTIPDGGYVILRFRANNPGFWYFHCHLEFHVGIGMGLVIQTGELDQMTPAPRNFAKCGNWAPDDTLVVGDELNTSAALRISRLATILNNQST